MPILAAAAVAGGIEPALLMAPAAMSASCAFMLPVATAPNAVIFGSGLVPIQRMAREGLAVNLAGALVIATLGYLLLPA
jgi:sodium-dependent dicarboxylate transporter 2/3/5